ncbi:synaptic vesicle glycoprotein 2C isoform X1 [Stomoxys calcitrans]|uniref:synaptic vesicle glycoprotein 2C isoform X1 n=1 Tax=Stomoxys calcitrans TaxID=35570 RepID=UPI0027E37A79|nr:synaptic vesicle glycoprotein 2C isoform X1 [Stomoxys calcitrans]
MAVTSVNNDDEASSPRNDNKTKELNEPADFEKAIDAAGFGLFNVLLIFIAIPATLANVFSTTTMAYILPIAECDLKLTLFNKGMLNAATYAGMISSAIIWGYLADTQGRKKILVIGYIADAICVFCSSLSQNFAMLVTFKFIGGLIVNGPGAVLFTYLTELHGAKHRPRVLMILGMITSFGTLLLPILAWLILPQDWEFALQDFNVHTWQMFLLICGLPSLICGLALIALPESPKFLMSQGRNMEALKAFQKIYFFNTRQPKNTYPIQHLIEEVPTRDTNANEVIFNIENKLQGIEENVPVKSKRQHRTLVQSLREGWQQTKPMFRKPLLARSLHVYLMQFCILLGLNTIRLWLPQLFASIAEFEHEFAGTDESSNLCAILDYSVNKTATAIASNTGDCTANRNISVDMYLNNIIVATSSLVGYCFAGLIIRALGNNRLLTYGLLLSGCLGFGLYWATSGLETLIISSLFITVCSISTSSLLGMVVGLFPTTMRTMIVAIAMMLGRLGALSGNLMFPILVEVGCVPPFVMVGAVLIFASALSCILPKKTDF